MLRSVVTERQLPLIVVPEYTLSYSMNVGEAVTFEGIADTLPQQFDIRNSEDYSGRAQSALFDRMLIHTYPGFSPLLTHHLCCTR